MAEPTDTAPMSEIQIQWIDANHAFNVGKVSAELRQRIGGIGVDMEFVRLLATPDTMLDIVESEADSTPKVKVFHATLKPSLLESPEFFTRIREPVQVDITVKPLAEQAMSAVMAGPIEITESCLVRIVPPRATIHWVDEETNVAGGTFEVEADGEDEMKLLVSCERFLPSQRTVAEDTTITFTHMTMEMYPPDIFGPHKDDLPWVVAKKGSTNRRNRSRWDSKVALPDAAKPDIDLPVTGFIRCRAWGPHDIAERVPNDILAAEDARIIAQAMIPVNLVPAAIKAELIEPVDPVPADEQPHELILEVRRKRKNAILHKGQVSWELDTTAKQPGGTIEPLEHTFVPEDAGRFTVRYTPPMMTYEPGTVYRQKLRVFSGSGPKRREMDPVIIDVNPALNLQIDGEKKGLVFDPPYELEIEPGLTPSLIVGHEGWHFKQSIPSIDLELDGNDVKPLIKALIPSGEVDVVIPERTKATGLFEVRLPELEAGLARMPQSRQRLELQHFTQAPPCEFDEESRKVLTRYYGYHNEVAPQEALVRLLNPQILDDLRRQKSILAKNVLANLEVDVDKAWHGTDVMLATMRGTVMIDPMHAKLLDTALDLISKLFWDALDAIIKVTKLGEKIVKNLPEIAGPMATWVARRMKGQLELLKRLLSHPRVADKFGDLIGMIDDAIRALSGATPQINDFIIRLWNGFVAKLNTFAIETIKVTEQAAVDILIRLNQFDSAVGYGMKKTFEWAIKKLGKLCQDLLKMGANQFASYHDLKVWLRDRLGSDWSLAVYAKRVVATNNHNVEAFTHPFDAMRDEQYLMDIRKVGETQADVNAGIKEVDDYMWYINTACDALWFLAAIAAAAAALGSFGGAAPIGLAALTTISNAKLALNVFVHLGQGYQIYGMSVQILDGYEALTLNLTGATP